MTPEPEQTSRENPRLGGPPKDRRMITLDVPYRDPIRRTLFSILKIPLEKILQFEKLNDVYDAAHRGGEAPGFATRALGALRVRCDVSEQDIARIPLDGPVVVVSNHPYGAVEGILLISLLSSVRRDVKVMANYILGRIPELRPYFIEVDPFGTSKAVARNVRPLKEALTWLRDGGMLGVFPAGEVSHLTLKNRRITDPPWSESIARLVSRSKASVLPVYFDGRNSALFQLLGLVHKRLRTVMLPHELVNKANKRIPARIGNVIPFKKLEKFESDQELTEYLRMRTYLLAKRPKRLPKSSDLQGGDGAITRIAEPMDPRLIRKDLDHLPEDSFLAENGNYEAYSAHRSQIPHLMHEIGRLREMTFREVGEGTGRAIDVDEFDDYYTHLFVWNRDTEEIVGAYRLGLSDEIIARFGIMGLYTRSLFKFKKTLIDQIGPAVELGRSFIRPEYQREYAPLHLLWRGIGQFILKHPQYRMLFGPVSITNRYQSVSRHLLMDFLKINNFAPELAALVKPTNPMKVKRKAKLNRKETTRLVTDLDEVQTLISELEAEKSGVPILLKHYLKLGGQLLGFNIDPNFNDALDGLILVDLLKTPRRVLNRYLGEEPAAEFLAHHENAYSSSPT